MVDLAQLPARSGKATLVVIESPRGSTIKIKYASNLAAFTLSRSLGLGVAYPYDFGFVPSTRGPDGDPIDALVVWDGVSPTGLVLPCRLIGLVAVDQKRETGPGRQRNDRILAVPMAAARAKERRATDLPKRVRDEICQFLVAATALEGRTSGSSESRAPVPRKLSSGHRSRSIAMAKAPDVQGLRGHFRVREVAPFVIAVRLAEVERHHPDPRRIGVDEVHDMRVSARRLRVALDVLGDGALDAEERAVKKLQDALGEVRDCHVQIGWLESRDARSGGTGTEALLEHEREMLAERERALEEALESWSAKTGPRLARRLRRAALKGKLAGRRLRRELERAIDRVEAAAANVDDRLEALAVHKLRIAAKKLRYLAELLRSAFPDVVEATLERLEPLQDAIGDLHDVDVRLALLSDFAGRTSGRDRLGIRALATHVEATRRERARAVERQLDRWRNAVAGGRLVRMLAA